MQILREAVFEALDNAIENGYSVPYPTIYAEAVDLLDRSADVFDAAYAEVSDLDVLRPADVDAAIARVESLIIAWCEERGR